LKIELVNSGMIQEHFPSIFKQWSQSHPGSGSNFDLGVVRAGVIKAKKVSSLLIEFLVRFLLIIQLKAILFSRNSV